MIQLSDFTKSEILNIFCDASIRARGQQKDGCYGAVAVVNGNTILMEDYRIASNTTNNNAEIKGVRLAVSMAAFYRDKFPIINIFSDSQISILGIRDRYDTWKCGSDGLLRGSVGEPIKSQEVFIEIRKMMEEADLKVNFWHQKGHVKNTFSNLENARHVFMASNGIRRGIDINLIRFISDYNNHVDSRSRSILYNTDIYRQKFIDPITFYYNGGLIYGQ